MTVLKRPSENEEGVHEPDEVQDNDGELYENDMDGEEQELNAEGNDADEMVHVDNKFETEPEPDKVTAAKGFIIDPIFGNTRRRLLMDDFPGRPRRIWDTWCQKSRRQRAKRRPLGYMPGDRRYEYDEWLLIKAKREADRAERALVRARGVVAAAMHQRLAEGARREMERISIAMRGRRERERHGVAHG